MTKKEEEKRKRQFWCYWLLSSDKISSDQWVQVMMTMTANWKYHSKKLPHS